MGTERGVMLGRWTRWNSEVAPYGASDSYAAGAEWLSSCALVEDWGCGRGWLSTLIEPERYRGVDGSPGPRTDIVADLREYRSSVPGIFIRHVLEHNEGWREILANVAASYTERAVVVLFTPAASGDEAEQIGWSDELEVPDLALPVAYVAETLGGNVTVDEVESPSTQYGIEFVLRARR